MTRIERLPIIGARWRSGSKLAVLLAVIVAVSAFGCMQRILIAKYVVSAPSQPPVPLFVGGTGFASPRGFL
jgi:hypothetical protein